MENHSVVLAMKYSNRWIPPFYVGYVHSVQTVLILHSLCFQFYIHVCGVTLATLVFSVFQKKLGWYMTPTGKNVFLSDGAGLPPGNKQSLLLGMVSSKVQRRLDFNSTGYTEIVLPLYDCGCTQIHATPNVSTIDTTSFCIQQHMFWMVVQSVWTNGCLESGWR
jgi:hypothetical protein